MDSDLDVFPPLPDSVSVQGRLSGRERESSVSASCSYSSICRTEAQADAEAKTHLNCGSRAVASAYSLFVSMLWYCLLSDAIISLFMLMIPWSSVVDSAVVVRDRRRKLTIGMINRRIITNFTIQMVGEGELVFQTDSTSEHVIQSCMHMPHLKPRELSSVQSLTVACRRYCSIEYSHPEEGCVVVLQAELH